MSSFLLKFAGNGWITATLSSGDTGVEIKASYLSDAPTALLRAIIGLLMGSGKETFYWSREPGQYGWLLSKDNNFLEIEIYKFTRALYGEWEERKNSGVLIFKSTLPLKMFALQVNEQFDQLLTDYGIEGYNRLWDIYKFPKNEKEKLERLLIENKG